MDNFKELILKILIYQFSIYEGNKIYSQYYNENNPHNELGFNLAQLGYSFKEKKELQKALDFFI